MAMPDKIKVDLPTYLKIEAVVKDYINQVSPWNITDKTINPVKFHCRGNQETLESVIEKKLEEEIAILEE